MWNTLKAESGYRKAISFFSNDNSCTIKDLMERIEAIKEKRCK